MKNARVAALVCAVLFSFCLTASGQTLSFTQAASSPYATSGTAPKSLAVYDYNLDGVLDVIVANSGTPWVNSSSANYKAWLGQKTAGKPNGALGNAAGTVGTGNTIPFYFQGFENNPNASGDRALNVVTRRGIAGYGYGPYSTTFYPAIAGAGLTTRLRNGGPWNITSLTDWYTFLSYSDLGHAGTLNPSNGYSAWVGAGDFNGEGLDGAVTTFVSSADSTTPLNYLTVMFGSSSNPQYVDFVGSIGLTMPAGLLAKRVFVGDVNKDGKADIVVTTGGTQVVVFLSQSTLGTGSAVHTLAFAAPVTVDILHPSEFVTIADADGDG